MAGESILIVDDNPADRKLARVLLMNEGFTVHTAAKAEEALALLPVARPRLVMVDILLPGMDGLELARWIKSNPATQEIIVMAVTVHSSKWNRKIALEAGCDDFFPKPLDTRSLPSLVAGHLGGAAGAQPAPPKVNGAQVV